MTMQAQTLSAARPQIVRPSTRFAIPEWYDTDEVIDDALSRFEDVMRLV